ncbi:hypothetical protein [Actinophytocola sp.]|uniref:hypothetical protein n=1 Tax=Actinophytocola sp. TaxID=1872138 RepID=UPI002D45ECE0|nr:hypothetical protein [Actinophytocola sp.]HYQ69723.1 hypothetical protein [Actinophytocola sp.]
MTAEHERLLDLVEPLRAIGWVFLPTTLAAPTKRRIVDALFGLRTHDDLEDNIQLWEQWATAGRLQKTNGHEIQVWQTSGQIEHVIHEILALNK